MAGRAARDQDLVVEGIRQDDYFCHTSYLAVRLGDHDEDIRAGRERTLEVSSYDLGVGYAMGSRVEPDMPADVRRRQADECLHVLGRGCPNHDRHGPDLFIASHERGTLAGLQPTGPAPGTELASCCIRPGRVE
jgi:hypothetical protein